MALPKHLQSTFLPQEIAFLAESEMVEITPRTAMDSLSLIGGNIARFRPPQRTSVPLWLAMLLRRQKRATLIPPTWLSVEELQKALKLEEEEETFSALPFRWLEISDLILDVASDDIPDADYVRRLLRDLRELRQAKARAGLEVLEDKHLQMDNLGLMEINEIRPLFAKSMDLLRTLQDTKEEEESDDVDNMALDNTSDSD